MRLVGQASAVDAADIKRRFRLLSASVERLEERLEKSEKNVTVLTALVHTLQSELRNKQGVAGQAARTNLVPPELSDSDASTIPPPRSAFASDKSNSLSEANPESSSHGTASALPDPVLSRKSRSAFYGLRTAKEAAMKAERIQASQIAKQSSSAVKVAKTRGRRANRIVKTPVVSRSPSPKRPSTPPGFFALTFPETLTQPPSPPTGPSTPEASTPVTPGNASAHSQ